MHRIKLFLIMPSVCVSGIMFLLLCFFAFLHCWLNLFGELLRFADRMFYKVCARFSEASLLLWTNYFQKHFSQIIGTGQIAAGWFCHYIFSWLNSDIGSFWNCLLASFAAQFSWGFFCYGWNVPASLKVWINCNCQIDLGIKTVSFELVSGCNLKTICVEAKHLIVSIVPVQGLQRNMAHQISSHCMHVSSV